MIADSIEFAALRVPSWARPSPTATLNGRPAADCIYPGATACGPVARAGLLTQLSNLSRV